MYNGVEVADVGWAGMRSTGSLRERGNIYSWEQGNYWTKVLTSCSVKQREDTVKTSGREVILSYLYFIKVFLPEVYGIYLGWEQD
jgi:hypothetical protein